MSETLERLLLDVAGLLTLVAQGVTVPNLQQQAQELLDKIGAALDTDGS